MSFLLFAIFAILGVLITRVARASRPADDAPGMRSAAPWQKEVVYQIYPRSFADGNGDGVGDLQGILSKVDYLHDLGVDMVWLCPVNRTTNYDNGYDVSDYLDIDPTFGTLADWEALRDALHARGIKIMMDLVLNHSSDAHPWFLQEMRLKAFARRLPQKAPADFSGGETSFRATMQALLRGGAVPHGVDANQVFLTDTAHAVEDLKKASVRATQLGYLSAQDQLEHLARLFYGSTSERTAAQQTPQDFYIWRDQPNNWTAIFSGSAWHLVESTGQYYLALFSLHQPDLNWHNPAVRHVMADIVDTWVKRGVDGFRLDSVGFIGKDQRFLDAPASDTAAQGRGMQYFVNQPAVHEYLQEMHTRALRSGALRAVGEVSFTTVDAALDYAGARRNELSEVFLFDHMYVDIQHDKWNSIPFSLPELKRVLGRQQEVIHGRAWIANYLENHDQLRAVSRFGNDNQYRVESATLLGTLLFSLEGTPYVYQGQEIGMTNGRFTRIEEIDDIEARNYYAVSTAAGMPADKVMHQVAARNRDNVRTVMQWDASPFAGFSKHTPWIKTNSNYTSVNVKTEQADPRSVLAYYKRLVRIRKQLDILAVGAYTDLLPTDEHLYVFTRRHGKQTVLVLLNFSDTPRPVSVDLNALVGSHPTLLLANYEQAETPSTQGVLRPWEARMYANFPAVVK